MRTPSNQSTRGAVGVAATSSSRPEPAPVEPLEALSSHVRDGRAVDLGCSTSAPDVVPLVPWPLPTLIGTTSPPFSLERRPRACIGMPRHAPWRLGRRVKSCANAKHNQSRLRRRLLSLGVKVSTGNTGR